MNWGLILGLCGEIVLDISATPGAIVVFVLGIDTSWCVAYSFTFEQLFMNGLHIGLAVDLSRRGGFTCVRDISLRAFVILRVDHLLHVLADT